jgi:hypothetical protein
VPTFDAPPERGPGASPRSGCPRELGSRSSARSRSTSCASRSFERSRRTATRYPRCFHRWSESIHAWIALSPLAAEPLRRLVSPSTAVGPSTPPIRRLTRCAHDSNTRLNRLGSSAPNTPRNTCWVGGPCSADRDPLHHFALASPHACIASASSRPHTIAIRAVTTTVRSEYRSPSQPVEPSARVDDGARRGRAQGGRPRKSGGMSREEIAAGGPVPPVGRRVAVVPWAARHAEGPRSARAPPRTTPAPPPRSPPPHALPRTSVPSDDRTSLPGPARHPRPIQSPVLRRSSSAAIGKARSPGAPPSLSPAEPRTLGAWNSSPPPPPTSAAPAR